MSKRGHQFDEDEGGIASAAPKKRAKTYKEREMELLLSMDDDGEASD